jgi:hypothetical protein
LREEHHEEIETAVQNLADNSQKEAGAAREQPARSMEQGWKAIPVVEGRTRSCEKDGTYS